MKIKIFVFCFFICMLLLSNLNKNDKIIGYYKPKDQKSIAMPLVFNSYKVSNDWGSPKEKRGPEHARYLSASVKITVSEGSGSGTLVYYDSSKNEAYVASCGHLWSGNRSHSELLQNPETCKITTWYHNETKLKNPKEYPAKVLFGVIVEDMIVVL